MASSQGALGSVLVIGGCGYLGSALVQDLRASRSASSISIADIRLPPTRLPNVVYHEVDICSQYAVSTLLNRTLPNVIFHTASPPAFGYDLPFYLRVNVDGTKNLLRAAMAVGTVKAFVYTSSASVVHDGTSDLLDVDDSTPVVLLPKQKSIYAHSKVLAERAVLSANRSCEGGGEENMLTVSIRLSGMFGENDPSSTKPLIEAARNGKFRFQMGDGRNLFDRTYVGNVVQAHVRAANALLSVHGIPGTNVPPVQRVDGEAFLITNDEPTPFWETSRAIGAAAGHPTPAAQVKIIPKWLGLVIVAMMEWMAWVSSLGRQDTTMMSTGIRYSMLNRTYNIEKAKKRLGYRPNVDISEAIQRAGASFAQGKDHKVE